MSAKMLGNGAVPLVLLALCVLCCVEDVRSGCPWNREGLQRWSNESFWNATTGKGIPNKNKKVTLTEGMHVLLDMSANVSRIEILKGASLIWDNQDGIELQTRYIIIVGELHIGAEDCKFNKTAKIRLIGTNTTKFDKKGFGKKFIGVAENGVLELHGKNKTSWTSLAQTVKKPSELECGFVYDQLTCNFCGQSLYNSAGGKGVSVIVWKNNGAVMDYGIFTSDDDTAFHNFFKTIPNGMVIGIHDAGYGLSESKVATIEGLGGSDILTYASGNHYSFVGKKGNTDSVQDFVNKAKEKGGKLEDYLSLVDMANNLAFQVSKLDVKQFFRVLDESVARPILKLSEPVKGWEPGDKVLITSTDIDWRQAEVRTIVQCDECCPQEIKVNHPFDYCHFGNYTKYVDQRAEVAMLSRSIVIEGSVEKSCSNLTEWERTLCKRYDHKDTFGGHLKILKGHNAVHVEGAELVHMGQQGILGSYPLHFHMCGNVSGMYLRQNTVRDSFSRCITVHGTNYLQVVDNVCFKHFGHGIFLEDAVEQNNTITGNLVAGTMFGSLLLSDLNRNANWCPKKYNKYCGDLSSYWITHPNNIIEGNVAAGSDWHGFAITYADRPLGPCRTIEEIYSTHNPTSYPIRFNFNKMHSTATDGLFVDGKIAHANDTIPENAFHRGAFQYYPLVNNKRVFVNFSHLTSFKNGRTAIWIKGGNIRLRFSAMADSRDCFSGGTSKMNSGSMIDKCLFVGETENVGYMYKKPRCHTNAKNKTLSCYLSTLNGVVIYQGPVLIENSYFDEFITKKFCKNESLTLEQCSESEIVTRYATGIGFKKASQYPFMSSSFARNNTFGYNDNETHHWLHQGAANDADYSPEDGNTMVYLGDKDGKLTGIKHGAVVNDIPIYKGPGCQARPTWGSSNLTVCPYRYIKLKILGKGGSLADDKRTEYPLLIWRTDSPYNDTYTMKGDIRIEYLLRAGRSYMVEVNKNLAGAGFSYSYTFKGFGVEIQDQVRIGLCQPKKVENFIVQFKSPNRTSEVIWVNNLTELDEDTTGRALFHDKTHGIFFFKIWSPYNDNNATQRCPEGKCWEMHVKVQGGNRTKLRSCKKYLEKKGIIIPSFVDSRNITRKEPPEILNNTRNGTDGVMPEGVGPYYVREPGYVVVDDFSVACRTPQSQSSPVWQGCFQKANNANESLLISNDQLDLLKAMTPEFCAERCYHRGYTYAGLSVGKTCCCGNNMEVYTEVANCTKPCGGNPSKYCGGFSKKEVSIWTTGN